jgi:shikimate dehydrogenase
MKRFAVIGNPISHSLSPRLHNHIFQQLGIDAKYSTIQCTQEKLPYFINQLRNNQLNGLNVTLPLKRTVLSFLDVVDEHAKAIGAVNCIKAVEGKLIGHNTDWIGFIHALQNAKIEISGGTCIIIGAGGVARSVAYALALSNVNKMFIINRSVEHATELLKQLKTHSFDTEIKIAKWSEIDKNISNQALIVNCTSVGMVPNVDSCPVQKKYLSPSQTIVDIIYSPFQTKLCRIGQSIGAKTQSGLLMFIHQALASLDVWFSERISEKVKIDELQGILKKYCQ